MFGPDIIEDDQIEVPFRTHKADGDAVTFTGTVSSFKIYKDETDTEKTTTNGVTLHKDDDSITGNHLLQIDTSNDTGDAGFWQAGHNYRVVASSLTVDAKTVSGPIGFFSIENQNNKVDLRKVLGTALSVAPAEGYQRVRTEKWGSDAASRAGIQSECQDAIDARFNLSAGVVEANLKQINEVAQRAADLAEIAQYLFANAATLTAILADDSMFGQLLAKAAVTNYSRTSDSQEALGEGAGASPETISDAVWDELLSGHVTTGSSGKFLRMLGSMRANKAKQVKSTGAITYYDTDGVTPLYQETETDNGDGTVTVEVTVL